VVEFNSQFLNFWSYFITCSEMDSKN
jgi:hypothetical protein